MDRRSPQGLSGVVAIGLQPSPPVCLSFAGTDPAPFTLGLIAACPVFKTGPRYRYAPPCPAIANSMSCTSSSSNDNRSSKGTPGTDPIKRAAASCLPDHPQHTQRGAVGGKDRRVQQRHHPMIICDAADLTVLPDSRVPHKWQKCW